MLDQTKLNQYIHGLKTYFPGGDKTALTLMMVADQGFHYSRTWSDVRDQFQQLFSEDNFPRDVENIQARALFVPTIFPLLCHAEVSWDTK